MGTNHIVPSSEQIRERWPIKRLSLVNYHPCIKRKDVCLPTLNAKLNIEGFNFIGFWDDAGQNERVACNMAKHENPFDISH